MFDRIAARATGGRPGALGPSGGARGGVLRARLDPDLADTAPGRGPDRGPRAPRSASVGPAAGTPVPGHLQAAPDVGPGGSDVAPGRGRGRRASDADQDPDRPAPGDAPGDVPDAVQEIPALPAVAGPPASAAVDAAPVPGVGLLEAAPAPVRRRPRHVPGREVPGATTLAATTGRPTRPPAEPGEDLARTATAARAPQPGPGSPAPRPATVSPRPAAPRAPTAPVVPASHLVGTAELLREHVAPALVAHGALAARDTLDLLAQGLEPVEVPDGRDVHVHIGRVEVQQPPRRQDPAPPVVAPATPRVDHTDYLERQRRRWRP
ncbi:hypothetical protein ACNHYB_03165 [Isoptericola jiangsuensis]|uniref:hypothetical protein n=1 Tax=Isoptericola jiangsuensis TaxID=548579 RepID=UPI003AAC975F